MKTALLFLLCGVCHAAQKDSGTFTGQDWREPDPELVKLKVCPQYPEPIDVRATPKPYQANSQPTYQAPKRERNKVSVNITVRITVLKF